MSDTERPVDFIRDIINEDLRTGKHKGVVTRFPPEPNGYLHIGHAKAICVNFGIARDYGGRCHLRMDDTNPSTEDPEYVKSIQNDIRWLGFDWGEHMYYASDYYEQLYQFAVQLIKQGQAYVCDLTLEQMREYRGTVTEPGKPSPNRDRSVDENLDLFARMRKGEFADGARTLRAKIDMASSNMKMRDPPLYRIMRDAHHYRTGDAWPIYPLYDFAHCLSDSLESITHSLCTLEFENNRELYDWLLDQLDVPQPQPRQYEYARLKLTYVVLSKRKLLRLVKDGHVQGWDDPRMPTLAGYRRRGYTPESIRMLCDRVGIAKANSTVDMSQLEHCVREDLNHKARRVMAVLDPLKVVITNYPEGQTEMLPASYWPHDVPKEGSREVPFTRELYIERSDFEQKPPKGFRRLVPGGEVRLRYGYVIKCDEVITNGKGDVTELRCSYDPDTRSGGSAADRKVKGTIHWVSASRSVQATINLYDRLFTVERPDEEEDFLAVINPEALVTVTAHVEESLGKAEGAEHYQFERHGYFFVDPVDFAAKRLVFNRVVSLKDSWTRKSQDEEAQTPKERAPAPQPTQTAPRQIDLDAHPAAKALVSKHGLSAEDALTLSEQADLQALFDQALTVQPKHGKAIANWLVNDVRAALKERSSTPMTGAQLGELVGLIEAGTISTKIAKDVLGDMLASGTSPRAIVEERGLTQVSDAAALGSLVDAVLGENSEPVARYREGNTNVFGFLVGQVMKKSKGKANPTLVNDLLRQKLGG